VGVSGAPFRDLFVELPAAVFEAMRDLGEAFEAAVVAQAAAVAQVAQPTVRPERRHIQLVSARYGWRAVELVRHEARLELQIVAELECGHRQCYTIDELAIVRAHNPVAEIELLDHVVDRTERGCQCVLRPHPESA